MSLGGRFVWGGRVFAGGFIGRAAAAAVIGAEAAEVEVGFDRRRLHWKMITGAIWPSKCDESSNDPSGLTKSDIQGRWDFGLERGLSCCIILVQSFACDL